MALAWSWVGCAATAISAAAVRPRIKVAMLAAGAHLMLSKTSLSYL
jgi:hypothetical protein